jgi:hypothetical protein
MSPETTEKVGEFLRDGLREKWVRISGMLFRIEG